MSEFFTTETNKSDNYQLKHMKGNQKNLKGGVVDKTKEGYIKDFVSGEWVKSNPEEIEAVQPFSRKLVEDYNYPKSHIQTRPQFKIKSSPSGEEKYPIDIAIFKNENRNYDNLFMIVECKQKQRKDGEKQLKIYMGLSSAQIGVWFNGEEHSYLLKVLDKYGHVDYKVLPNIPKFGQRIEDIGKYKRKDLTKPKNLKIVFKDMRNHLAGNITGITRDEEIAKQIINILFCKIYDEINTGKEEEVEFRAGIGEEAKEIKKRIIDLFENKVMKEYDDVFDKSDDITLDEDALTYVVGELQNFAITEASRDAIGDAFEVFIGPALRGSEGQFFTPRNVIKMVVNILDPEPNELIIDPACGSGGFLIIALEHIWKKLESEAKKKGWSETILENKKRDVASRFFRGIDKDSFLAKVTKSYMAIVGDGRGGVFCENTLKPSSEWNNKTQEKIQLKNFNILMTNPPFGAKIPIKGEHMLSQYDLGHRWKFDKNAKKWEKTEKLQDSQPPQILFIERCLQLLKEGGRMGIVLPDGILGNITDGYIRQFVLKNAKILGVIDCPPETFQPSTSTKTSILILQKQRNANEEEYPVFMAVAKKCGHDRRGKEITEDDFLKVAEEFRKFKRENNVFF